MSFRRVTLTINGVQREILCNQEQETLADALRKMGLTGTKTGCKSGHCGACSVILDKKLTRACLRPMSKIQDFSVVETIEGMGTAENPHPLQKAFLVYAAVQCGFCSPGFILSAKALLYTNDTPTREEVRAWFTKNNNVCRCTGYKPIVDAVMAAAAVMRGERTMDDLRIDMPADGSVYGSYIAKPSGLTRVLGTCDFGADIALKMPEGSWQLAVVIAKTHRARILNIDSEKALAMPGVARVITAKDVRGTNRFVAFQGTVHSRCHGKERPVIVEDQVFRYGDVVAVVAATTRAQARAAAAQVLVEYEEQTPMLDFLDAVAPGAENVHADMPNIYMEQPLYKGDDTRAMFDDAAHTVEGAFSTTRQPHLPMEPDVVQAYPEGEGVTIQCKTQFVFGVIGQMAGAIGLEAKDIRIIGNPAGGSFGYSMSPANYALTAVCALAMNAPVSLELSYPEHQHMTGKRSPIHANARLACDASGKLTALDGVIGVDHGAYSEMAGALTTKIMRFMGYYYAVPNIRALVRTCFSNANFGTAYRAFGSPQTYTVSESLVDMLAAKMGIDPFDFRYNNLAQPGELSSTSVPYREYPMQKLMDILRPHYDAALAKAKAESTDKVKRGVGIALGGYHVSKLPDKAEVDLELRADGGITVYNSWADVGQGADLGLLVHTHEALRALNIAPEQIRLHSNDTAHCPDTGSASGSRSHHVAGNAIIDAAKQLMDAMRKDDGTYRTQAEMVAEGIGTRYRGVHAETWADIDPDTGHGYGAIAQNYMVFLTSVAVDVETGKTTVLDAHIAADIGKVGSYQAVLGQAWGGFAHSVGFALTEDYSDAQKHETLRGAGVVRCNEVPDDIHVYFNEEARETGPHGSTGCAEGFQSSGHVAILNAIANATGARITTLPASPEKVKAALEAQAQNKDYSQASWELGCELYERLEALKKEFSKD